MPESKLRFLFIQPEFNRHYVPFLPVYEPLHGLICAAVARHVADARIFDRRFDTDENLAKVVQDFAPDLVGITTHVAGEIPNVHRLLSVVKAERPEAVTIIGGQHATLLPEDMYHESVDLICIGPGEETFRDVVEAIVDKTDFAAVPGLAVRRDGEYLFTDPRVELIVVGSSGLTEMGVKALGQGQYGGLSAKVVDTLEEAIDLARSELALH